jgi:hypothetical protein
MHGPLAIEVTLGGLLGDLPAPRVKPRDGANQASSLLSSPAAPRTLRKLWIIAEHDVASVVSGPR